MPPGLQRLQQMHCPGDVGLHDAHRVGGVGQRMGAGGGVYDEIHLVIKAGRLRGVVGREVEPGVVHRRAESPAHARFAAPGGEDVNPRSLRFVQQHERVHQAGADQPRGPGDEHPPAPKRLQARNRTAGFEQAPGIAFIEHRQSLSMCRYALNSSRSSLLVSLMFFSEPAAK